MLQPGPRVQTTYARMERSVLIIGTITNVAVQEDILECTVKLVRDKMSMVNLPYKLTDFCGLSLVLHGCTDLDHWSILS